LRDVSTKNAYKVMMRRHWRRLSSSWRRIRHQLWYPTFVADQTRSGHKSVGM